MTKEAAKPLYQRPCLWLGVMAFVRSSKARQPGKNLFLSLLMNSGLVIAFCALFILRELSGQSGVSAIEEVSQRHHACSTAEM